jgi:hypothetical protein
VPELDGQQPEQCVFDTHRRSHGARARFPGRPQNRLALILISSARTVVLNR